MQKPYVFPDPVDLPLQDGLADPFLKADGSRVSCPTEWPEQREYLKAMLAFYLYGQMPEKPNNVVAELLRSEVVLNGEASCLWYKLYLQRNGHTASLRFNVLIPKGDGPFPLIIKNAMSIYYLDSVIPDDLVGIQRNGVSEDEVIAVEAIKRQYAVCKFIRTDLAADEAGKRNAGVYPLYPEYDWGAIAVWSWAYQLIIDVLEKNPAIDQERIIATGHSRGGKTALCAAIYDERITLAVPNSSGLGGTASMRYFEKDVGPAQNIASHKGERDYWWGFRCAAFANREEYLPFDSHMMKALIAPRYLLNPHARQDYHANPYGTELTHRVSQSIFEWLGYKDHIAMHWRDGGHAQNLIDWTALLDFADLKWKSKNVKSDFQQVIYPNQSLPQHWNLPRSP